jgi:hypothetical protein
MTRGFVEWFESECGRVSDELLLEHAFAIAVCRIEDASAQSARDPIAAVSNRGSAFSRVATKSMLGQLGYSKAQTRIVQRLLAGSGSSWPGLIRLYLQGAPPLTQRQRRYITRQLREFRAAPRDPSLRTDPANRSLAQATDGVSVTG